MKILYLLLVVCGGYSLAQEAATSPEAVQASVDAKLRGYEMTGVPLTAPRSATPREEAGVISAARLRHKVPKRARQAYDAATKLARAGKHLESSQEFSRCIRIDPEFADAHNKLGEQYVLLGQLDDAKRELERAMELDPAFAAASINLGWLELRIGNLAEAERHSRRAITLSAGADQARLLLAAVLARYGT